MLYLLKYKVCGEVLYIGKRKPKFRGPGIRGSTIKQSKHRAFRKGNQKVTQKRFHAHCRLDGHSAIDDWDFVISE